MPITVLTRDAEEIPWELIQNTIDDLEASQSGHPGDPDTYVTGYVGDSLFRKVVPTLDGGQVQLVFQITWTAIDRSRRWGPRGEFDPDFEVMGALMVGPDETVWFVDYPDEALDDNYTWQHDFAEDQEFFIDEALDDAGDQLYTEML